MEFKSAGLTTWNKDEQVPGLAPPCEPVSVDHLLSSCNAHDSWAITTAVNAIHKDAVLPATTGVVAVNVVTHANESSTDCIWESYALAGTHSRIATWHGCLARGARRSLLTAWLPHGRRDCGRGFRVREYAPPPLSHCLCSSTTSLPHIDCRPRAKPRWWRFLAMEGDVLNRRHSETISCSLRSTVGRGGHAVKKSRFHISIEARPVQSANSRIRASTHPAAHHKAA